MKTYRIPDGPLPYEEPVKQTPKQSEGTPMKTKSKGMRMSLARVFLEEAWPRSEGNGYLY